MRDRWQDTLPGKVFLALVQKRRSLLSTGFEHPINLFN